MEYVGMFDVADPVYSVSIRRLCIYINIYIFFPIQISSSNIWHGYHGEIDAPRWIIQVSPISVSASILWLQR